MNYQQLVTQIRAYANRPITDERFTAAIPYFIDLGQQRIWREAKDIGFEKITQKGSFTTGVATIQKPADWNKTISLQYGTINSAFNATVFLYLRTYEFCRAYWPNPSDFSLNNPPLFYADHQEGLNSNKGTAYDGFFISPTPDKDYVYQLVYLRNPNLITENNNENFLTERYPDLLFYACFLEALSYLKNDERIPVFESLYNRALQSLNNETKERYTDRTSKRDKD
jgi:hypothetical protein